MSRCPAATMVQCVGSVETWTKTIKMTKSSLMPQWHPQYLPGVAAGKFQGGTLFVGMNVKGPVPHAQRTEWRSMRVLASVDLWLLVQGVLSPAAMPMCLLKASSRAVCWTSAWVGAAKTYCARHWLPMLLPVKLLASKSRTGGLRPVVRSPALTTATMSSVAHPAQPAAHPLHDTQPQLYVTGPVWRDASVTRASS